MTFVRNCWYALAWDSEVDHEPLARTVCDVPILAYRKLDRSVRSLVRLS